MSGAAAIGRDTSSDPITRSRRARPTDAPISPTNKSRVTNGRLLINVDLRTSAGRRYRDLCRAFESEIGGALTESDRAIVRQAAGLTLKSEQLQEAIIRGEVIDETLAIRLAGAASRALAKLKAKARKPDGPTLASYLQERHREAAE
jgi:hypothetical protein